VKAFLCGLAGVAIGLLLGLVVVGAMDGAKIAALKAEAEESARTAGNAAIATSAELNALKTTLADRTKERDGDRAFAKAWESSSTRLEGELAVAKRQAESSRTIAEGFESIGNQLIANAGRLPMGKGAYDTAQRLRSWFGDSNVEERSADLWHIKGLVDGKEMALVIGRGQRENWYAALGIIKIGGDATRAAGSAGAVARIFCENWDRNECHNWFLWAVKAAHGAPPNGSVAGRVGEIDIRLHDGTDEDVLLVWIERRPATAADATRASEP